MDTRHNPTDTEDETKTKRPMNAWEVLAKIFGDLTFAVVFLSVIGLIYLLLK
jgi:hypothetical protein